MTQTPAAPHPAEVRELEAQPDKRSVPGGEFLLDQPKTVPAIWGHGSQVAWAQGEPFYLAGGIGTGKTTLGGQVFLARIGIGPSEVLGLPVQDDGGRVLYLAMDRPSQIARALARNVGPEHRDTLDRRATFWRGPLPFYLPDNPDGLLELARTHDATTLIVDSLKDLAPGLEKPEVGWAVNAAFQRCVTDGVQVAAWHHQKKSGADGRKPTTLADLYGSTMIAAGAGSVVLLWGNAGDPVVELTTLKPAADLLGPWTVVHDQDAGTSRREADVDPLVVLRGARRGITARGLAQAKARKEDVSKNEVERARRDLERLTRDGFAIKQPGADGTTSLYLPAARQDAA